MEDKKINLLDITDTVDRINEIATNNIELYHIIEELMSGHISFENVHKATRFYSLLSALCQGLVINQRVCAEFSKKLTNAGENCNLTDIDFFRYANNED